MLDPRLLRSNLDEVCQRLSLRHVQVDKKSILALESERRAVQTETEQLQAERNKTSRSIGQLRAKGEDNQQNAVTPTEADNDSNDPVPHQPKE